MFWAISFIYLLKIYSVFGKKKSCQMGVRMWELYDKNFWYPLRSHNDTSIYLVPNKKKSNVHVRISISIDEILVIFA